MTSSRGSLGGSGANRLNLLTTRRLGEDKGSEKIYRVYNLFEIRKRDIL